MLTTLSTPSATTSQWWRLPTQASYAFLTDGENWIRVEFDEESEEAFYNDYIKGGTLKGTLKGIELNPYLIATAAPEDGEPQ